LVGELDKELSRGSMKERYVAATGRTVSCIHAGVLGHVAGVGDKWRVDSYRGRYRYKSRYDDVLGVGISC